VGEIAERLVGAPLDVSQNVRRRFDLRESTFTWVIEQGDARNEQAVEPHGLRRFARRVTRRALVV
jgi:hypothetical protein